MSTKYRSIQTALVGCGTNESPLLWMSGLFGIRLYETPMLQNYVLRNCEVCLITVQQLALVYNNHGCFTVFKLVTVMIIHSLLIRNNQV